MLYSENWMYRGQSPPARGAWIEIDDTIGRRASKPSPPARGAWIKITDGVC